MELKCPACGWINLENTWQCLCGHYFVTSKKKTAIPGRRIESQPVLKPTSSVPSRPARSPIPSEPVRDTVPTEPARPTIPAKPSEPDSAIIPSEPAGVTIPSEPASPSAQRRHGRSSYRWRLCRLVGRGVVKVTLLLLTPAMWIAGAAVFFPDFLEESLPLMSIFMLLFFGVGLFLFWITNVLSESLIGEKTCYPAASRFWSYETEHLIQELRAQKRKQEGG